MLAARMNQNSSALKNTGELPRRLDDKARREAIKVGLVALRARGRRATTAIPGGFRLLDRDGNCVAGDNYDLSAEDVIKFCNCIP
jgi:hypothetical protein